MPWPFGLASTLFELKLLLLQFLAKELLLLLCCRAFCRPIEMNKEVL